MPEGRLQVVERAAETGPCGSNDGSPNDSRQRCVQSRELTGTAVVPPRTDNGLYKRLRPMLRSLLHSAILLLGWEDGRT